jgi:predicted short-subunit dehydrogenase-like oxidoreductase (DUF2520 family)
MRSIAFIGAGRLAQSLMPAMVASGVPVAGVASRSTESAQRAAARAPGCIVMDETAAAQCALVFITVPDDAIAAVAARLPWRRGQRVVHCSGATEVSVLAPAARCGASIGGFHPLQIFSDTERAIELIAGSTVAIEGDAALEAELREIAEQLRMRTLHLPPGARALYHGGASYAASFLLSMLDEAASVWRSFGIDQAQTLQALLPLAHGTLQAAASKGLAGALAGPVSRGDAGVVRRHCEALERLGDGHAAFYRELTRRQLRLARASGRLDDAQLQALSDTIG